MLNIKLASNYFEYNFATILDDSNVCGEVSLSNNFEKNANIVLWCKLWFGKYLTKTKFLQRKLDLIDFYEKTQFKAYIF